MTYIEQINQLIDHDLLLGADYYKRVKSLITAIYEGHYEGDQAVVGDTQELINIRQQKINEGRSTKSILSATDFRRYVLNDVFIPLTHLPQGSAKYDQRKQRALFILGHIRRKKHQTKEGLQIREEEALESLFDQLRNDKLEEKTLTEEPVRTFINDINFYKSLEDYFRDTEILASKKRSQWKSELPFLLVILGISAPLFSAYVAEQSHDSHRGDDTPVYENKYTLKNLSLFLITVAIVILLIWLLDGGKLKAEKTKISKPKSDKSQLSQKIIDTELLGKFVPIKQSLHKLDSLQLEILSIKFNQFITQPDTIPVNAIDIELSILNPNSKSAYIFEGIALRTETNMNLYSGTNTLSNNYRSEEEVQLILTCEQGQIIEWMISNPTGRVLLPGQETKATFSVVASERCEDQMVTFDLGFLMQKRDEERTEDIVVWLRNKSLNMAINMRSNRS